MSSGVTPLHGAVAKATTFDDDAVASVWCGQCQRWIDLPDPDVDEPDAVLKDHVRRVHRGT